MRKSRIHKKSSYIFPKILTVLMVSITVGIVFFFLSSNIGAVLGYLNIKSEQPYFKNVAQVLCEDGLSQKAAETVLSLDNIVSGIERIEHILQIHEKLKENSNNLPANANTDIGLLLQNPELPTGCEVVSLTMVLNFLGFDITKTDFADNYLEYATQEFPIGYMGDPYSVLGAGIFPPGIVKSANNFFNEQNSFFTAFDISDSNFDTIEAYIASGIPVIMWTTIDYDAPVFTGDFVFYNGMKYNWYQNEHCVVLSGYSLDKNTVTILDPLSGYTEMDIDIMSQLYDMTGRYAVAIY